MPESSGFEFVADRQWDILCQCCRVYYYFLRIIFSCLAIGKAFCEVMVVIIAGLYARKRLSAVLAVLIVILVFIVRKIANDHIVRDTWIPAHFLNDSSLI